MVHQDGCGGFDERIKLLLCWFLNTNLSVNLPLHNTFSLLRLSPMSTLAMIREELETTLRIKFITFEVFEKTIPDLSFIKFVQWVHGTLTMPKHLHMWYLVCHQYLALTQFVHNEDPETGIKMSMIFREEEDDANAWWDAPEVSFFCLLLLA